MSHLLPEEGKAVLAHKAYASDAQLDGHRGSEHVTNNEVLPPRLPDVSETDRIVLVARLKAGGREHAAKLLADGVEPIVPAFVDRWEIFLSASEVVFLFEGEGAHEKVLATLDDPVMSTALEPWLPLFEGPLHRAYEASSSEG
jgi:hypothetical protein